MRKLKKDLSNLQEVMGSLYESPRKPTLPSSIGVHGPQRGEKQLIVRDGEILDEIVKKARASDGADVMSDADPSLRPDAYEKILGVAATVLFLLVSITLIRGRGAWAEIGPLIWVHRGLRGLEH